MSNQQPEVTGFFDDASNNISYVVIDSATGACAIIDAVLGFDLASGRVSTTFADMLAALVRDRDLDVEWVIDTHVHADHVSAGHYLKEKLGGKLAIGAHVSDIQKTFAAIFNLEKSFATDGQQFDHLFSDGEAYRVGNISARAIHTPGHTPACMTHVIGDAAFVGDTLFMPDFGTARCDFPGGDATTLYRSIQKIFSLPEDTRIFLNHDYKSPSRDGFAWETTVGEQKRTNIHVGGTISEAEFVKMRTARDETLPVPNLMVPSVQINIRAGQLPPAEENGISYIKLPINTL